MNQIIKNMPFDEYMTIDAASKHGLEIVLRSPAHYLHARRHPKPPTPSQALGQAAHTLIQEPKKYAERYIVAPEGIDRRTTAGKETMRNLEESGKTILTVAQADILKGMLDAVWAHPIARRLYAEGEAEQTMLWTDEETDLECKGRLDWWNGNHRVAVDLKTAADASSEAFSRAAGNYGYHLQAAHYLDGLSACGVDARAFLFVVVENEPPHGVAIYQLDEKAIHAGRLKIRQALEILHRCKAEEIWPSYPTEIQTLELKPWSL